MDDPGLIRLARRFGGGYQRWSAEARRENLDALALLTNAALFAKELLMVNVTCQTIFCYGRNIYRRASAWRNRQRVNLLGFDATDRLIDRLRE